MPTYLAADIAKLEYTDDSESPSTIDTEFIDPSGITITVNAVRQGVNEGKQVTAYKEVEVELTLFDRDTTKSSLATIEQSDEEITWTITLLDGTTIETAKTAPISIEDTVEQGEGLLPYTVLSTYHVDRSEDAYSETPPS